MAVAPGHDGSVTWGCYRASMPKIAVALLIASLLAGCGSMLPRSKETTASPWQSYQEVQQTFDKIVPGQTTFIELKELQLDPQASPNIAILNYSDVLRRFVPNASVSLADLDVGVKDCISAKTVCTGYEVNQKATNKKRDGNFLADFLGFHRETQTTGWSFNGLLLVKDGVVIYKLTGGQPVILQHEETRNPLGPAMGLAQKLFGTF
jgi:hypothetical protein